MFQYRLFPTDTPVSIPREMDKFKCLILAERKVSKEYKWDVSKALIETGCLFSLARGIDCEIWHDSVDWAFLEHYNFGDYPDGKMVMTSWHEDETLQETIEFAKICTKYSDVKLDQMLVLDFGTHERAGFIEDLYVNA